MKTQDEFLQEMLENIPSDLDKSPSSPIYTALAPFAAMLSEVTFNCEQIGDSALGDTATGLCQTRLYAEYGVNRFPAASAIRQGVFTPDYVAIGSRFGANGLSYVVLGQLDGIWQLRCETAGTMGNSYFGSILPLDNLNPYLESAALTEVLIYGNDEEDDEAFRTRFYGEARYPEHGWNKKGYEKEIKKISGVGDVAVLPTPNGQGGRIHCVIVDPYHKPASSILIDTVQQLLDPDPRGEGNGLVPPGHTVTITTVTEKTIKVSAAVAVKAGFTLSTLKLMIEKAIADYLSQVAFTDNVVRLSRIEAAILTVAGVVDIAKTLINGSTANVNLSTTWETYEIPTLGEVTLEVM